MPLAMEHMHGKQEKRENMTCFYRCQDDQNAYRNSRKSRRKHPHTEIFFVTGEDKAELEQLGIDLKRCIFKPYMIEDVKNV